MTLPSSVAYTEPTGASERKPRFVTGACNIEIETAKLSITDDTLAAKAAVDSAFAAGQANAQSIPVYIAGKTQIIHDATGTPAAPAVKACFAAADARISKCEASRKADSVVIAKKDSVIKDLQNKPEPVGKRFQFFGAVGYAVRYDSAGVQAAPAFRVGVDTRVLGPVVLTSDVQLSMPGRGHATPQTQATILGRVNF